MENSSYGSFEDYGILNINMDIKGEQRTTCPQCSATRKKSKEKCLAVNVEKGVWFCHHCGWHGILSDKKTETLEYEPVSLPTLGKQEYLYEYFKERGISKKVLKDEKLFIGITRFSSGELRQAICFPYYIGDKIVNIKYRSKNKEFHLIKGAPLVFYRFNDIIFEDEVIITEGEIDTLSYVEAGFTNVISVPDGAPPINANTKNLSMSYLNAAHSILKNKKKFYLSLDNDQPGRLLKEELARRLGKAKCYIVKYPDGCKDANDVLVKYGIEGVKKLIAEAMPYPIEGALRISDVVDGINDIYYNGFPDGVKSGMLNGLDNLIRIFPKRLTVVTGIPNHGKSPFVDQMAISLAETNGWKTAFFSPENGSVEIHALRLIRQRARKDIFGSNKMNKTEFLKAQEFVNEHIFFVLPGNADFSIDNILDLFAYFVSKEGVKNVVIDPWNTVEHSLKVGERTTEYVGRILNKFKFFAKDFDVHFIVVAHPFKQLKDKGNILFEVPTMYSISDSANWYNVPDMGITIYRRYDYTKRDIHGVPYSSNEIHIQKVKFDFMGKLGMVECKFDVPSQRFFEADLHL